MKTRSACFALLFASSCFAQSEFTSQTLTLRQAVEAALDRYPLVRVSEAEVRGAASAIQLARTAYLPLLEGVAGVNRATRNNTFGLLLPSQILAPISGPVLNTNGLGSAWGSTVGMLATWEPFDFGFRKAQVAVSEAGLVRAKAVVDRTRLEIATVVADSVLTVVAGEQAVVAASAAVSRSEELVRITDALVRADLRPGAELSLALAEQAAAQVQLIRARQAVAEARSILGSFLGIDPKTLHLRVENVLSLLPKPPAIGTLTGNPMALEQNAAAAESEARLKVLDRAYFPHLTVQGTTYARGTGALVDGRLLDGVNGLGPTIQNWGLGFTASFSVLEYRAIRAKRSIEVARLDAEKAKYDQVLVELRTRLGKATAAYDAAIEIVQVTPASARAGNAAVEQARARYQAGLGTALEVADAQRRLAQAEIDDSLARLSVWRARLAIFAAAGDITPLLTEASQ